jgi:hypothetical protein
MRPITNPTILAFAGAARIGLALSFAFAAAAGAAAATQEKTITCPFLKEGLVTFDVPAKAGSLPTQIDFDYPVKATRFAFGNGRLSLTAVDESDPHRVRIVISAQLDKSGAYRGTIFTDSGGNQLMHDKGPVRCTVGGR